MTVSRKRPLLAPDKITAPPTETTRRLEKLLDGRRKRKKQPAKFPKMTAPRNAAPTNNNANNNVTTSASTNRFAHPRGQPTNYNTTNNNNNNNPFSISSSSLLPSRKPKNVLASQGGLASASTFRKSKNVHNMTLTAAKERSRVGSKTTGSSTIFAGKRSSSKMSLFGRSSSGSSSSSRKESSNKTAKPRLFSRTIHRAPSPPPEDPEIEDMDTTILDEMRPTRRRLSQDDVARQGERKMTEPTSAVGNSGIALASSSMDAPSSEAPSNIAVSNGSSYKGGASNTVSSSTTANTTLSSVSSVDISLSTTTNNPSLSSIDATLTTSSTNTTTTITATSIIPLKLNILGNSNNKKKKQRRITESTNLARQVIRKEDGTYKLPGAVENLQLPPPPKSNDHENGKGDAPPGAQSEKPLLQGRIHVQQEPVPTITTTTTTTTAKKKKIVVNNDNFVRQNLKNSAGACRGARKKKEFRGGRRRWGRNNYDEDNEEKEERRKRYAEDKKFTSSQTSSQYTSRMTGLDPLDEFLDGAFHTTKTNSSAKKKRATTSVDDESIPICVRHQRPCKLITVKKTSNKGRKFYACSMPRGEQCDHFQWAEDTIEAARATIAKNSSHSSFIARQVTAHVNRFRPLTVPELRDELAKRRLDKNGKKAQLLMRLAVWTRDEISKSCKEEIESNKNDDERGVNKETENAEDKDVEVGNSDIAEGGAGDFILLESDDDEEDEDDEEEDDDDCSADRSDNEDFVGPARLDIAPTGQDGEDEILEEQDDDMELLDASEDSMDEPSIEDLSTPLSVLRSLFGHTQFREGQEWAIRRCLAKQKSVLVAPTGFGKSLCYALPAAMMDGVCVVVSPLISLIEDQLRSLPPRVPAATLSGSISTAGMAAIVDDVIRQRIKILFVSPERLTSPSFRRLFNPKWNPQTKQMERRFPDISLLCVDEAHCMSQWAHNFRPCFLRFKSLLNLLAPKSLLAITATAGPRVLDDICDTLDINRCERIETKDDSTDSGEGIRIINKSRDNIDVACQFVEHSDERLSILASILKPKSKKSVSSDKKRSFSGIMAKGSVIVYVWRQYDTQLVAEYLNSSGISGGIVAYHGGMDATARSNAQSKFMRGKARICVATVAFGLGIDKADIEGIVHMYISNSPEHYLQEIGRAGRDGRRAKALALPVVDEIPVRHSLSNSNLISKSQIKILLSGLRNELNLTLSKLPESRGTTRPLFIGLPIQSSVIGCDCKVETLDTLLSLIEQKGGADPLLYIEGFNYDRATIAMKKRTLEKLAATEDVAKSILAVGECLDAPLGEDREVDTSERQHNSSFQRQFLAYSMGSYTFSVARCAGHMGPLTEPRHVFAALKRLQSSNELEFNLDTTDAGRVLHVKLSRRGVDFFTSDNFEIMADALVNDLHEAVCSSIISGADKVVDMHLIMQELAVVCENDPATHLFQDSNKSPSLVKFQELTKEYFQEGFEERQKTEKAREYLPKSFFSVKEQLLENDALSVFRDLPCLAKQVTGSWEALAIGDPDVVDYTALSVAKFLHGIDSPRAPRLACRGHGLFGKWQGVRFSIVLEKIQSLLASKNHIAP